MLLLVIEGLISCKVWLDTSGISEEKLANFVSYFLVTGISRQ